MQLRTERMLVSSSGLHFAGLLECDFAQHKVGPHVWRHPHKCSRHGRVWRGLCYIWQHHRQDPDSDALRGERIQGRWRDSLSRLALPWRHCVHMAQGCTISQTANHFACMQEYDTEAAFSAAVLLSFMALSTLLVKERLEQSVERESEVR